jgi:hypothetical protein
MKYDFQKIIASYPHLIQQIDIIRIEVKPQESHYSLIFLLVQGNKLVMRDYYFDDGRRKYSFHVQDSANNLIFRYDNEPHWAELPNFPFHKHLPDSVESSPEMTLEMVFAELETMLSQ